MPCHSVTITPSATMAERMPAICSRCAAGRLREGQPDLLHGAALGLERLEERVLRRGNRAPPSKVRRQETELGGLLGRHRQQLALADHGRADLLQLGLLEARHQLGVVRGIPIVLAFDEVVVAEGVAEAQHLDVLAHHRLGRARRGTRWPARTPAPWRGGGSPSSRRPSSSRRSSDPGCRVARRPCGHAAPSRSRRNPGPRRRRRCRPRSESRRRRGSESGSSTSESPISMLWKTVPPGLSMRRTRQSTPSSWAASSWRPT